MALAHGIPPSQLMNEPDEVIITMADVFEQRHREAQAAKAKASRNSPGRSARARAAKGH